MPPLTSASVQLSAREARRLALSAALLAGRRPDRRGPVAMAGMFGRLGMVQIDSVSVLARAHYMPAFSRLGAYDPTLIDRAAYGRKRSLFEYWGHEASLIRLDLQPSLRWRMARARDGVGIYGGLARFGAERAGFVAEVLADVARNGPLSARELAGAQAGRSGWWEWSDGKRALEWLFWAGLVTTRARRSFERVYDLTERVFPAVAALPTPDIAEAQRTLFRVAARALGIATAGDLRAYWRIGPLDAAARIPELVEAGWLIPVQVEGWRQPAFMPCDPPPSRRPAAAALVSPFDPLLWERDRAERLFGLRYRIEIYTPAAKREHGYYVLPFLMKDQFAARLDLRAERARGRLVVAAAHLEPRCSADEAASALARELAELGGWLNLSELEIEPRGDLAAALRERVAAL